MPVRPPVIKTTGVLMLCILTFAPGLPAGHDAPEANDDLGMPRSRVSLLPKRLGRLCWRSGERLCKLAPPCLSGMVNVYGASASSLFRGGRGGGQSHACRRTAAAHGTAVFEPPDSRPRISGRRTTSDAQHTRHRADGGGTGLPRTCETRSRRGGGGRRSSPARGPARQALVRAGFSHWTGAGLAAGSHEQLEGRTP